MRILCLKSILKNIVFLLNSLLFFLIILYFFKYYKALKTTKKLENFILENEKIVEICQKLFTKNIFDLRINTPIDDVMLVEMIASFLSSTNDGKQRNYK